MCSLSKLRHHLNIWELGIRVKIYNLRIATLLLMYLDTLFDFDSHQSEFILIIITRRYHVAEKKKKISRSSIKEKEILRNSVAFLEVKTCRR